MEKSEVFVSMKSENQYGCSFAVIRKKRESDAASVLLILNGRENVILDYQNITSSDNVHYLLLKQYSDTNVAYIDFLKLIGKMCKKSIDSKYFLNHIEEDNRLFIENIEDSNNVSLYNVNQKEYDERKEHMLEFIRKGLAENIFKVDSRNQ